MTSSPVAAFTSGGPPRKIVPVPVDDDRLVRHRRHVGAARGARAHHDGNLRNPVGGHARLVEEDAPEVIAIGKDLGLQREKRAARIHQVDARQAVVERDLLRAHVLLDRDRVVRAALHRRIVGDDEHLAARHAADAGDDARRGRVVVVHVERGERGELEKRRSAVEQAVDALADRQLALIAVALHVFRAAALPGHARPVAQFGDELLHAIAIAGEGGVARIDVGRENNHVTCRLRMVRVTIHSSRS